LSQLNWKRTKLCFDFVPQRLNFLTNQLKAEYPVEEFPYQEWRNKDIKLYNEVRRELEGFVEKKSVS
jgi:hypothetical protein